MSVSTTEYSAALFAGQVGLFAVVLPYLFFTLLSLVIGSISSLTSNLCLARIGRNLRRMVWKKVVHLPLQFYESNNPKELLSRITTDVTSISTLIMQVLLPVFTTAYSSLLMLGRVSSYDQRLMWALVIVLPVNILISFVLGRMRFGVADLINRRNAQLTAAIAERANNMLLIKSMGTEEKEAAAGEARMKASYQAEVTDLWVRGLALPINAIASALQSVAIILAGRAFYSTGALDLTQWIAYYGFAIQLTNILSNYCNSWSNFKGRRGLWTACPKSWTSGRSRWTRAVLRKCSGGTSRCGTCASPTGRNPCLPTLTSRSRPEKLPRLWAPPAAARQRC